MDCHSFSAQSNSRRSPGESPGTELLADSLIPVNASAFVIPPERFLSKLFLPCDFSSSEQPPLPLPPPGPSPPTSPHQWSLPPCLWAAAAAAAEQPIVSHYQASSTINYLQLTKRVAVTITQAVKVTPGCTGWGWGGEGG